MRADLLDASKSLEEAALDRYAFLRDAYFQRRRNLDLRRQPAAVAGGQAVERAGAADRG